MQDSKEEYRNVQELRVEGYSIAQEHRQGDPSRMF